MQKYRLSVVGCSVGIRLRPPSKERSENKLYPEILVDLLSNGSAQWHLFNNCRSRLLSTELIDHRDTLARQNPDIVILNIGAVDAPNREVPKWYSDILFRRKWFFLHAAATKLYNALIKKFLRRPLVFLRMKSPWVGPKRFERELTDFLGFIDKDLKSKVVVLGINPGNERIERELPGSLSRYTRYNTILKGLAERHRCLYIDPSGLCSSEYFPDGVHYNAKGHRWCAEQLFVSVKEHLGPDG